MLLVKLKLVDGLSDDLLERGKDPLLDDDLGVLGLVNQVCLDEEVPHGINGYKVDLILKLVGKLHYASNHSYHSKLGQKIDIYDYLLGSKNI